MSARERHNTMVLPRPRPQTPTVLALTRRELLRRAGVGGAALMLPGALAACEGPDGPVSSEATAPSTGTEPSGGAAIEELTWGTTAIRALDYASGFDVSTGVPLGVALESLLTYDADLRLTPLLAESWSQPDPETYVFVLRSGVTFWDGTPLTTEDVVFSLERHRDPEVASEMGYYFNSVDSVEATGPSEVTVRLNAPDPFFAYVHTFASITPKAFSEELGSQLGAPGTPVNAMGTGPYRITAFRADDAIDLERNESYWGEQPTIERITVEIFADPQTMQLAMRAGEIDGTFQVPLAQADQWSGIDGATTIFSPGMTIIGLYFRVTEEPWSDIHVRRAFAYSIDREGLVRSVLGDHAQVASCVVPPSQWGGLLSPDAVAALYEELSHYSFDPDRAREELAQSSVPDGFSATVQYPNNLPEVGNAFQNLRENLAPLNVDLEVTEVTPQEWFADLEARTFPFGIIAFGPDYADPANYPAIVFSEGSDSNRADFQNPDVTRLLEEQQAATDPAVRAEAISQILRITTAELPYLNLWWPEAVMAISERLQYDDFSPLWYNQVWVDNLSA